MKKLRIVLNTAAAIGLMAKLSHWLIAFIPQRKNWYLLR